MPVDLGQKFRVRVAAAEAKLRVITEASAQQPDPEGAWSLKEVVGHLLDSAVNNHLRFALAAVNGSYTGPEYDGDAWVRLHSYAKVPVAQLIEQWRTHNDRLANLVERIPEAALPAACRIGDSAPVTLRFLIEDYLDHLDHHVSQITEKAAR